MNSADVTRKQLFKAVGIAEASALVVGSLYVTGYYVNSIFVRNYGIPESELFRLEYIKIGLVFWLLNTGIVLIPFGSFYLTYRVRRASGLPHFYVGWIGNSLNTTVMLFVPLVLSFFATRYEWFFPLPNPVLGCNSVNMAVGWGLGIASFGTICVPLIERAAAWYTTARSRPWVFRIFVEPLRFGCLLAATYLIGKAMLQIPWLLRVFGRGVSFIAVAVLFVGGITAAIFWVRHIARVRGSGVVFLLIGFGVTFFYYLSLTSYVFGVYPAVPANRGGRMPVTEAYMETSGHDSLFLRARDMDGFAAHGPVYILEQTSETIYFASGEMDEWFDKFVPVHGLSANAVPYIRFERIEDGFPRVQRKTPAP